MPDHGFGTARITGIRVILLAMVSVIGVACDRQSNRDAKPLPTADIVKLEARDFSFVPSELNFKTAAANPAQGIGMVNLGPSLHNFSIESLGIDLDIEMDGRTHTLPNVFLREEGTFEFFCKYHRDQGMSGTIVVSD